MRLYAHTRGDAQGALRIEAQAPLGDVSTQFILGIARPGAMSSMRRGAATPALR